MHSRTFDDKVILLTGADGEIGTALIQEMLNRKARKIYVTGIAFDRLTQLASTFPSHLFPVLLDVTDENSIQKAVVQCQDVNLLINNAGVELKSDFIGEQAGKKALLEMQINYIGVIYMINHFLPILQQQKRSQILNILSVGSATVIKGIATYCTSKTAAHLLTQSLRPELATDAIELIGVYPGYVDSAMSADVQAEKITLTALAQNICNDFEQGLLDIYPDSMSKKLFEEHPISIPQLR
ncbi:SDR family NAD(P)-dependent oxidoreductase [Myroides fluvii]|uniref:SDR family NAD(P)-dependent oxidoreductase n=1 Tax=Myroides fluvii TaxID=2572594 RepID=UPI00131DE4C3|nr:SDR family NAD(P)-dependent oxidoreductase [Myroides fluvii]